MGVYRGQRLFNTEFWFRGPLWVVWICWSAFIGRDQDKKGIGGYQKVSISRSSQFFWPSSTTLSVPTTKSPDTGPSSSATGFDCFRKHIGLGPSPKLYVLAQLNGKAEHGYATEWRNILDSIVSQLSTTKGKSFIPTPLSNQAAECCGKLQELEF